MYGRGSRTGLTVACRPITSDMVDDQMPLIGIPSFIKPAGPSAVQCTHYFVSVRPTACVQPPLPTSAPDTAAPAEASCTTTLTKRTSLVGNPAMPLPRGSTSHPPHPT